MYHRRSYYTDIGRQPEIPFVADSIQKSLSNGPDETDTTVGERGKNETPINFFGLARKKSDKVRHKLPIMIT